MTRPGPKYMMYCGNECQLPPYKEGSIYYTLDTHKIFLDLGGQRVQLCEGEVVLEVTDYGQNSMRI